MTKEDMLKASELMKSSRCSAERIAAIELERLARIYELAEHVLPVKKIKIHYLKSYKWPEIIHNEGDSCFDLRACEDAIMYPGYGYRIPLGVIFELPEGYGMVIRPRSSLSNNNILLQGGEIDPDYRGEVMAPLFNAGKKAHKIFACDRIVQARLIKIHRFEFKRVGQNELSKTNRGANGFGSTGTG